MQLLFYIVRVKSALLFPAGEESVEAQQEAASLAAPPHHCRGKWCVRATRPPVAPSYSWSTQWSLHGTSSTAAVIRHIAVHHHKPLPWERSWPVTFATRQLTLPVSNGPIQPIQAIYHHSIISMPPGHPNKPKPTRRSPPTVALFC